MVETRVCPVDRIVRRVTPPRRASGDGWAGSSCVEDRPTRHEKLIVVYAYLENADSDLLSLIWLTLLEWNWAPCRHTETIIMTDAARRTGLDCAQAAPSGTNTDWSVVGDSYSETTTANTAGDQAGLCLGNTGRNGDLTASTPMFSSRHWLDCIALGQERLDVAEIQICCDLGNGLQLSSHFDHVQVHVRLPPARRWLTEILLAPAGWAVRDDSLCEGFCATVEHALSTLHLVDSDLLLGNWYGSMD